MSDDEQERMLRQMLADAPVIPRQDAFVQGVMTRVTRIERRRAAIRLTTSVALWTAVAGASWIAGPLLLRAYASLPAAIGMVPTAVAMAAVCAIAALTVIGSLEWG